jgi:hypothetical protein
MPSKKRFGHIRSNGSGFINAGKGTIPIFTPNTWPGANVTKLEKDGKFKRERPRPNVVWILLLKFLTPKLCELTAKYDL